MTSVEGSQPKLTTMAPLGTITSQVKNLTLPGERVTSGETTSRTSEGAGVTGSVNEHTCTWIKEF